MYTVCAGSSGQQVIKYKNRLSVLSFAIRSFTHTGNILTFIFQDTREAKRLHAVPTCGQAVLYRYINKGPAAPKTDDRLLSTQHK